MVTNSETAVEAAKSQDKFDVLAFIADTAYPVETVTVFKDAASAAEYKKLVDKRNKVVNLADDDSIEATEALNVKIAATADKLSKSAIIFELRGMPPGVVTSIVAAPKDEDVNDVEKSIGRDNSLIAATIVSASNVDGVVDSHVWTDEEVAKLRYFLKEGEFSKLVTAVGEVNFNAAVFDQATDAGFSGGSADVA